MRTWFAPAVMIGVLAAPLMSSCFYSPIGSNTSPVLYPSPENGKVALRYFPPKTGAAKATFVVKDHPEVVIPPDDAPDDEDGLTAQIDTSKLTPGVYIVDVSLDDEDPASGHMTLFVPGVSGDAASPAASPDTTASADATASK
ncbi:MAG: hypothetical protein JWM80_3262 [Cyanobacteria bacterium RYN_339]|nr:hypothetical protein [Cyanobacteria bacterium RYN_339]